jgi:hypothetical protein
MTDFSDDEPASEALREVKAIKSAKANRNKWVAAGVATGIGSAAVVAALMFANKKNKDKTPR